MKKTLHILTTSIALLLIICAIGCEKVIEEQSDEVPSTLIEESRQFFEQKVRPSNIQQKSMPEAGKNFLLNLVRKPLWENASLKKISTGDAVVVPLAYDKDVYSEIGVNKLKLTMQGAPI